MSKKLTKGEIIERANILFDNKYDYSLLDNFENNKSKIKIICPIHGIFEKTINSHLNGSGCKKCSAIIKGQKYRSNTEEFIAKAKKIHNHKYDYSKVKYVTSSNDVIIICPEHGEFLQTPQSHLSGSGCQMCGIEKRSNNKKYTTEEFINKAKIIHNNKYDYSNVIYNGSKEKIKIICPEHGEFKQIANDHMNGHGCPICKNELLTMNLNEFISKAKKIHNNKYDYSKVEYSNNYSYIRIVCPEHGEFLQTPQSHLKGYGCNLCGRGTSNPESEIVDFIKKYYDGVVEQNNRQILSPNEIDLYIPDLNIGIEYNGLYWHSDIYKKNNYHHDKMIKANDKKIRLIQIFEDEWLYKRNIVESKLLSILNLSKDKIYARKTLVSKVKNSEFNDFLNKYHIQGTSYCSVRYGLYYENMLIAVMGFRKNNNEWDLNRFASSKNVVGGFSKLLKYFTRNYNAKQIYTFADLRYSDRYNNVYLKNGFSEKYITKPNYYYVNLNKIERYNRINFQKHKLKNILKHYDDNLTEVENMKLNNYYRIFDCGNIKYLYESKDHK